MWQKSKVKRLNILMTPQYEKIYELLQQAM